MWAHKVIPSMMSIGWKQWYSQIVAILATAFLCIFIFSPPVFAADATWENGKPKIGDTVYEDGPKTITDPQNDYGLAKDVEYFEHIDGDKVEVVYFTPSTDVEQAQQAQLITYKKTSSGGLIREGARAITIDKKADIDASGDPDEDEDQKTSCAVNGIGYILCPVMDFIASSMDWAFDVLRSFLDVEPLSSDQNSSMYIAWSYMRTFANIAFIIAFLVMVFSYVTSTGVSQYDIRKMAPRLIIASILVNTSYYICAAGIDISNILGRNLQDLLIGLRNPVAGGSSTADLNQMTWSAMTGWVLSAGAITGGIAALAVGAIVFSSSAITFLVPVLVSGAIAVLIAVVILAARQALITVLVVLAPLAFCAYVLPNTEKYFEKWRGMFMTMLIFYPIFSVLFGGSQLAALIIANNAQDTQTFIFAMFIQVMPLALTPLIIKFSGSLLGKLSGIVNNPMKGVGDRANNWAKAHRDEVAAERRQRKSQGWRTPGLATTQWLDRRKRARESRMGLYESNMKRMFNASKEGMGLNVDQKHSDMLSKGVEADTDAIFESMKRNTPDVRADAVKVQISEMQLNVNKAETDTMMEAFQSNKGLDKFKDEIAQSSMARQVGKMQQLAESTHVNSSALQFAQDERKNEIAQNMMSVNRGKALREAAAGIAGDKGEVLAGARAVQEMRSDFGKASGAMKEMMEHYKISGGDYEKIANMEEDVNIHDDDGNVLFSFKKDDEYAVDGAIEASFEGKANYAQMRKLAIKSGRPEYDDFRGTIANGMLNMQKKAGYMGGRTIDTVTTGGIKDEASYYDAIRTAIAGGKFKQEWFATNDALALEDVLKVMTNDKSTRGSSLSPAELSKFRAQLPKLQKLADETLKNKNLAGSLTDASRPIVEDIASRLHL